MTALQLALVGGAAFLAGALNSVAGGGSFLTLPSLVFCGVPPLLANATSTVTLWPGSLASAFGYRRELDAVKKTAWVLAAPSLIGGALGALLLVRTPSAVFVRVLPFLMLAAALAFTWGDRLTRRAFPRERTSLWVAAVLQLVISIYGGYFGGGMGLMMLAAFVLTGLGDIHRMNALKSALAVLINGAAVVLLVAAGKVVWAPAVVMTGCAILGGFAGASWARTLDPKRVRRGVTVLAWALTAYFFARA